MRLRNLNTFVKVARLGSFHAAAQQLHATQPAISARIAALEDELGVQLFLRDKSGTRLTARGTQLLPYAEKLIAISQEMKAQLQEGAPERGCLRIGVADTLAYLWLTKLLQHWRDQHPLMAFELTCDVTPTLIRQLRDHQLDLALMVAEQQHIPELVTEPLCSYPQYWVVAPALLGGEQIRDVASLARLPILSFPRNTRPWRYLKQLFETLGDEGPVLHTCSSVANLLALAEQGTGAALLPEPLVRDRLAAGTLVRLSIGDEPPELTFCCGWRLEDDRMLPKLLAESAREIVIGG
ncbi:LysR family transcriptional regulator [Marinobacterium arenosum]|uniref:LysR family transcriptional regulator n=1 Tax=Marinobacterium arenosum TaxID=2862496 RepID=UPI001C961F6B|nr:LysR family transcriptional regulator [Marinobacterium arenosum]MBY4677702.1 LysR family transcriptional regulator [Marinobacterium arenosum]